MGRAERIAALVAWTILASVLFTGFGMVLGGAVATTLDGLGIAARERLDLLVFAVRALAGLGMLGVSRVYRMTAGRENAGSLAAWLAGWTLVLYSAAGAATLVDEQAAPLVLLLVLSVWVLWRISRYFARYDAGDGSPDEGDPGRPGGGGGPGRGPDDDPPERR